ncbi:MAG: DUF5719 family protein [Bifidobacteriaceae bacterium]|jgi:hypothetical protein|nr:DUF5719 family protein [Bifidobacteriaceae bacterium]
MKKNSVLAVLALFVGISSILLFAYVPTFVFSTAAQSSFSPYNIDVLSQQTICSGEVILPDKTELDGADPSFDPMPEKPHLQTIVNTSGPVIYGSLFNLDETQSQDLNQSDINYLSTTDKKPKLFATAFDNASNTMGAAGVSSSYITKGDLKGLAVDNCQKPTMDNWLIGGNTNIKSSPVLVINNSSASAGTANLDVYTNNSLNRPIDYSATKSIAVPAHSQKRVLLSAGALNQAALAVHVKFYGAAMTSLIQYSELDGITPKGVDFIKPVVQSNEQIISGISIKDNFSVELSALALNNTSASIEFIKTANDKLKAVSQPEVSKKLDISLNKAQVNLSEISGLTAGNYMVKVQAADPLITSVKVTNKNGNESDLAFFTPSVASNNTVAIIPSNLKSDIIIYPQSQSAEADFVVSLYGDNGKIISQNHYNLLANQPYHFSESNINNQSKQLNKPVQFVFINSQSYNTKIFAGSSLSMANKQNEYFISGEVFTNLDTSTQTVYLQNN